MLASFQGCEWQRSGGALKMQPPAWAKCAPGPKGRGAAAASCSCNLCALAPNPTQPTPALTNAPQAGPQGEGEGEAHAGAEHARKLEIRGGACLGGRGGGEGRGAPAAGRGCRAPYRCDGGCWYSWNVPWNGEPRGQLSSLCFCTARGSGPRREGLQLFTGASSCLLHHRNPTCRSLSHPPALPSPSLPSLV